MRVCTIELVKTRASRARLWSAQMLTPTPTLFSANNTVSCAEHVLLPHKPASTRIRIRRDLLQKPLNSHSTSCSVLSGVMTFNLIRSTFHTNLDDNGFLDAMVRNFTNRMFRAKRSQEATLSELSEPNIRCAVAHVVHRSPRELL